LTVGNRIENRLLEVMAELNHFLVMATWTEPAAPTAECQDVFVMANRAFDTGEAFPQIPTFKVFSNYMGNYRPIKAVFLLEEIVIAFHELEKVMIEKLPQRGLLWFS
jgi:hypothetical protein